jgi:hypothetical protein
MKAANGCYRWPFKLDQVASLRPNVIVVFGCNCHRFPDADVHFIRGVAAVGVSQMAERESRRICYTRAIAALSDVDRSMISGTLVPLYTKTCGPGCNFLNPDSFALGERKGSSIMLEPTAIVEMSYKRRVHRAALW